MPEIARFYGLIIKMYFTQSEHNPPHIHVIYGDYTGSIDINKLVLIEGDLPNKALSMALEWTKENQTELQKMWDSQKIEKLAPLE